MKKKKNHHGAASCILQLVSMVLSIQMWKLVSSVPSTISLSWLLNRLFAYNGIPEVSTGRLNSKGLLPGRTFNKALVGAADIPLPMCSPPS